MAQLLGDYTRNGRLADLKRLALKVLAISPSGPGSIRMPGVLLPGHRYTYCSLSFADGFSVLSPDQMCIQERIIKWLPGPAA